MQETPSKWFLDDQPLDLPQGRAKPTWDDLNSSEIAQNDGISLEFRLFEAHKWRLSLETCLSSTNLCLT